VPSKPISAPRTPRIQSLTRASAILDIIARKGTASLADISAAAGLNKSTAYYLVESLVDLDFVERLAERKGYHLGLRNLELGRAVQRRLDIAALSRASLIRLCHLSKETVNLAVPHVFDAMIIESLEGAYGVRATSYAGSRAAYHSTACGKAILAFLEEPVRQAIYDARGLPAVTANTVTRQDQLEEQLATIRSEGYSIDSEENETGANCVAAPIRDGLGEVGGSISVSGLASRMNRAKLVDLAAIIIQEASAISTSLGGQPRL
jgi:DNA-binding IclR family transcriptional regulator